LKFKEQVLFKFENKISAVQWERKTFRLKQFLTPTVFMVLMNTVEGKVNEAILAWLNQ
jgi:hypothetical protein